MLGFRGHCLTKSRAYSTTYGQLRVDRANHRTPVLPDAPDTATEASWRYAGRGYSPGEALFARGIAEDIATNREIARWEATQARGWERPNEA
jgi:hypothetical protein